MFAKKCVIYIYIYVCVCVHGIWTFAHVEQTRQSGTNMNKSSEGSNPSRRNCLGNRWQAHTIVCKKIPRRVSSFVSAVISWDERYCMKVGIEMPDDGALEPSWFCGLGYLLLGHLPLEICGFRHQLWHKQHKKSQPSQVWRDRRHTWFLDVGPVWPNYCARHINSSMLILPWYYLSFKHRSSIMEI